MSTDIQIRELSLDMLLSIEKEGYGNLLMHDVLDKYAYLPARDKAFLKRLTDGVTERRLQLDYVLNQYSKVPTDRMKPLIRNVLRMGVYQILYMDSVPDPAACNEAVKLTQKRHFGSLKGYVNGVLRTVSRQKEEIPWPDRSSHLKEALSVAYSMPAWIVGRWLERYGEKVTERILDGLLSARPVTIRLSRRLTGEERQRLLTGLEEAGARPRQHPLCPEAYELKGELSAGRSLQELPGYKEGKFMVQDAGGMLAVEAVGLAGRTGGDPLLVLDVCAAPGGKALYAAELVGTDGRVLARDLTETKLERIRENAARMRITNLTAERWDAQVFDPAREETADVLICDLPCSGLGVAGRKPDIKYRVTPESIGEVSALQRRILSQSWRYLKPGGLLLYSTCTISLRENEETADWLAASYPLTPVSLKGRLPEGCFFPGREGEYTRCQLLPGIHGTDGFFIACFERAG